MAHDRELIFGYMLKFMRSCVAFYCFFSCKEFACRRLYLFGYLLFFHFVFVDILRMRFPKKECYFCDRRSRRRVLYTTVKLDSTLEYQCRTDICLVAALWSGMKKRLPSYFVAVTLLIISTGMERTETLSKWLRHRGKTVAEKKTESHSLRCGKIIKRKVYTP